MAMNIKNEEAHRLARELTALTGETVTAAVTQALRERLERVQRDRQAEQRFAKLMAIAKETGPLWKEPWKSMDHADLLYDEQGLPK